MSINKFIRIGDKMKSLRVEANLTQQDVANMLNIPRSTYANYEKNTREPNEDIINSIADVFGVNVWDLILDEDILRKDLNKVECIINFLFLCGYKVKFYDNESEIQSVDLINIKSGDCKHLTIDDYNKLIDKINKFIDFEFYNI